MNNNDHANHRLKDPEHRTVEFMSIGEWDISHGGPRKSAGRQGPIQVATAAIMAGTPESPCKTHEEFERLLEAAAESVGCTESALPRVTGFFSTVPRREAGEFIPNPAYDEEEFKALPKQKQISKRERMMKYLQGPDGQSLRREVVVLHNFEEGHPPEFYRFRLLEPIKRLQSSPGSVSVAKLKHHYEQAFIALFSQHVPAGWMADRAPAKARVSYVRLYTICQQLSLLM